MATNSYFQTGQGPGAQSEQSLVESNIIEMIQMAGHDCIYIKKAMFNPDYFYKETPSEKYEDYYTIEMYINSVSDFGGPQADYMSKFGLQVNDTADFVVSRKRFQEVLDSETARPNEGDLIYLPLTKHLFEINHVDDEPGEASSINQFYSLSRLYTFSINCSLFQYSYEDFDTDIADIDTDLNPDTFSDIRDEHDEINTEGDVVLDWSEDNPFGETTSS